MGTRVDALIKWILGAKISHEDFVEKSVWSNQIALRIGTAFGVLFELCNICRVLFFSNIGTMANHRSCLRFYLVYLVCCVAFLIIDFCCNMSVMARYRFYMISVGMILFWHLLFNMHDVYLSGAMAYFTIVTAIFFLFRFFDVQTPLYHHQFGHMLHYILPVYSPHIQCGGNGQFYRHHLFVCPDVSHQI